MRCALPLVVFVVVSLGLTGCGSTAPPMNVLKGKVSLGGAPLPGGEVTLFGADGKTQSSGLIGTDGSYSIPFSQSVTGTFGIALKGSTPSSNPAEKKAVVDVPAKYKDAKTSGLTVTVKDGVQILDIDLKK